MHDDDYPDWVQNIADAVIWEDEDLDRCAYGCVCTDEEKAAEGQD